MVWNACGTAFLSPFASFARWTLSRVAGILELAGAVLWFSGVSAISQEASTRLAEWAGFSGNTQVPVSADWGTYISAAGGIYLLANYFLTRIGKLDAPMDSSPPDHADPAHLRLTKSTVEQRPHSIVVPSTGCPIPTHEERI